MTKVKEIFYDEKGKVLDLSGKALRKQDALEAKKAKKPKEAKEAKSVLSLKELLAEAKELGLKGYSKLNKTKLGEIINEARKRSSEKGK